jgi:hypothetical protein
VLAVADAFAWQLPVPRALEWSIRLRTSGVPGPCALALLADDGSRSPRDRVVAAALVMEGFGDRTTLPAFLAAADLVPETEVDVVTEELRLLAPGVAAELLAA